MGDRLKGRLNGLLIHPGFLAVSFTLLAVLVFLGQQPPAALDESAPDDQFSASRTMVVLEELLAESQPHVAGSLLNREIRSRIEARLTALGYQPEIQSRFHCNPYFGACANIENIIAVREGSEGNDAVLVTAHYDSSWAGPGAGDDMAGTASIIEIARMANEMGDVRNDIIFLITDAEEQGLIGAHAFAEHHPLFSKVRVVINIEARGVSGPSAMFETGDGNRSMIRILARSLERPVANSLSYEVYKRMPNDTDYSMYRNKGVMGVNFAFTGGVALYHSRLDDPGHLDTGSVQHQGQNAWSMLLSLADRDIARPDSKEDMAYVDLFGRVLAHYPIGVANGLTLVLTVLVLFGIILVHKAEIRLAGVIWAVLAQLTVIVLFLAGAWLLNWPLGHMVETNPIEHPLPWAARIAIFSMGAAALWFAGKLFAHRCSFGDAMLVCWASFAALALLLDFRLPAASFIGLLPMAAFFLGMLVDFLRWRSRSGLVIASTAGFWMAAYLAVYFFYLLGTVFSFESTHLVAGPLVLVLISLVPMWTKFVEEPLPDWRPGLVLLGVVLLAAIYHQFIPGFSEDRPRGMNLVYRQVPDESEALLFLESPADGVDRDYAEIVEFNRRDIPGPYSTLEVPLRGDRSEVSRYATVVPSLAIPAPAVSTPVVGEVAGSSSGDLRNLSFEITAPPGCERIVIAFPNGTQIASAHMRGVLAIDGGLETKRGTTSTFLAFPYPGTEPVSVDVAFEDGLPAGFNVVSRHRFPAELLPDYEAGWPKDAQPIFHGFRAEVVSAHPITSD